MVTFDSTDLDNATSENGVVHESVANTDHNDASNLKQGYSIENPYLSADLVGYWPLQENAGTTAYDFSGNGNHGTTNGGVTVNQPGILGTSAYSFDGVDDNVSVPNTYSPPLTITYLTNLPRTDQEGQWIDIGFDYNNGGILIKSHDSSANNTKVSIWLGGNNAVDGLPYPPVGEWVRMTVTIDPSGNIEYYLGATYEGTGSGSTGTMTSTTYFGAERGSQTFLDVDIADMRIYNRVLSASEIQTLYDVVNTAGTLTTPYKSV